jgi:hypothetical protein
MKILQSQVQMHASRRAEEQHQQRESLTVWQRGAEAREIVPPTTRGGLGRLAASQAAVSVEVEISPRGQSLQPTKVYAERPEDTTIFDSVSLRLSVLKLMVERLTGREFKVFDPAELNLQDKASEVTVEIEIAPQEQAQPEGWGLVYDYYESHYESEQTSFKAEAVVRTADGREISATVELNMSREFFSEQQINIRAGDALKDPLVINFSGKAAELTERNFSFDLDLDGRDDQIAFVSSGSGFLALDRNGDGEINDGSELFGPATGSGFTELAAFDDDGNLWIDENDSVYDRLRIWSMDENGDHQLMALGQHGVGAIYLGSVETRFALKDDINETLGQIRETGIYLEEEGGAGTIQQLDLVV